MVSYYDTLLILVPVVFVFVTLLLISIGLSVTFSVPIAAFASIIFVGHGLFVNPPVPDVLTDSGE